MVQGALGKLPSRSRGDTILHQGKLAYVTWVGLSSIPEFPLGCPLKKKKKKTQTNKNRHRRQKKKSPNPCPPFFQRFRIRFGPVHASQRNCAPQKKAHWHKLTTPSSESLGGTERILLPKCNPHVNLVRWRANQRQRQVHQPHLLSPGLNQRKSGKTNRSCC